jgi:microcystin-dependent protein
MKGKIVSKFSKALLVVSGVATFGAGMTLSQPARASEPFLAEIIIFAGNFNPRGWLFCDGQLLQISQNSALFSLLGTTYGGDGRTTFGLPDLRGRVPMHEGTGPGLTSRRLGEKGGLETVNLTTAQMPSHTHAATTTATTTSTLRATTDGGNTNVPTGNVLADDGNDRIYKNVAPDTSMSAAAIDSATTASTTVGNTGGSQAHTNVQPYTVLNFIIATQGVFPSRN